MAKDAILFIGDFQQSSSVSLLQEFIEQYGNRFLIVASGYSIQNISFHSENVVICGMNSADFQYYKCVAPAAVIHSNAVFYKKEKANQKVIYLVTEFDERSFAGAIMDIDAVVARETASVDYFKRLIPNAEITQLAPDNITSKAFIDHINIRAAEGDGQTVCFVSYDAVQRRLRNREGASYFIEQAAKSSHNNIVLFSLMPKDGPFTSVFLLNNKQRALNFLKKYKGPFLYEDETARIAFHNYMEENKIDYDPELEYLLSDIPLLALEESLSDALVNAKKPDSVYHIYRDKLEEYYIDEHCENIPVSFVLCRYNTPCELLERAVGSVLNCGHKNVEIVIVDDGSKEQLSVKDLPALGDSRVRYLYCEENAGIGPARNFGVSHATGKYVFFLDCDDSLLEGGICHLIAHAEYFKLEMVGGKRIICDGKGTPVGESMRNICGEAFRVYDAETPTDIYSNVMVTSNLYLREAIIKHGLDFTAGTFEDVELSARIYTSLKCFHMTKLPVYLWYRYGEATSISSHVNIETLRERIRKTNIAWNNTPEEFRYKRIPSLLQAEFALFYDGFSTATADEQLEMWRLLKDFFLTKREYWQKPFRAWKELTLLKAFEEDNYQLFEYAILHLFGKTETLTAHDDYVVMTHYHLYSAFIHAINRQRPSRLYLLQGYASFDYNLIRRIRETGIFSEVEFFSNANTVSELFKELNARPEEAGWIIPSFLYGVYKEIFKNCNPEIDTLFLFSDMQPYWYYLERSFTNVVKLEDAYNSFDREVKNFSIYGIWAGIEKYAGSLYPKMYCESDKIKSIVVSSGSPLIPEKYRDRLCVQDIKELRDKHIDEVKRCMSYIYELEDNSFNSDSVLVLTQPLALFGYCTMDEQKKLYKKICDAWCPDKTKLLIKPHPSDTMNYSYLGGTILKKSVPIEVYDILKNSIISNVISFASSANETLEIAQDNTVLFKLHDFEKEDVINAIQRLIADDDKKEKTGQTGQLKKTIGKAKRRVLRHIRSK